MINQPHHLTNLSPAFIGNINMTGAYALVGTTRHKHKMKDSSEQTVNITIYILKW